MMMRFEIALDKTQTAEFDRSGCRALEFPTEFTSQNNSFTFRLREPRFVRIASMEEAQCEQPKCLKFKRPSHTEICRSEGKIHYGHVREEACQDTSLGFYHPQNDAVFINWSGLVQFAELVQGFLKPSYADSVLRTVYLNTLVHELVHATINVQGSELKDLRLSEGIANLIPYMSGTGIARTLMDIKASMQTPPYNYFYLISLLPNRELFLKDIIEGRYQECLEDFNKAIASQAGKMASSTGYTLKIHGDMKGGFCCFGERNINLGVGGTVDYLCNTNGVILVNHLARIDGILSTKSVLVANQVDSALSYDSAYLRKDHRNFHIDEEGTIDVQRILKNADFIFEKVTRGNGIDLDYLKKMSL
jgi:hypothetical protein